MIIDTDVLRKKIQDFEDNEIPDYMTCSIKRLELAEKNALNRRRIIEEFEALCEEFL